MNLNLIGIAGTNGSGKDTLGHMLAERHGFLFVSVTDLLRNEAKRRGLVIEREVLSSISAEWRRENGLGVLIDKALQHYELTKDQYKGLAIASLRNFGEADRVHELGGRVVWVDAEVGIRYQRVNSRQRTTEDAKTFQQFKDEEAAEMHRTKGADSATLDVSEVKDRSDITIVNNDNVVEAFKDQAEQILGL